MKICHLILLFISPVISVAQNFCGKIQKKNQEPVVFASIVNSQNTKYGILSDIDGRFCLNNFEGDSVIFSCIGYEKKQMAVKDLVQSDWIVTLIEKDNDLGEVVVSSEQNPANRIIKRVIKFQKQNNPDERKSHQCTIYNKIVAEFLPDTVKLDSVRQSQKLNFIQKKKQKSINESRKDHKTQYLILMESITERSYQYPQKVQQRVINNRVSGFENPIFVSLANDVQPFSFYGNEFRILHKFYHSPIATDALNYYDFTLKDTLYIEKDTVYSISFSPKTVKKFESLKGILFINTKKYAVQNTTVEPYEPSPMSLKIEQKYQQLQNGDWFPEQLNFTVTFEKYPDKYMGLRCIGKSFISNVKTDVPNDAAVFNLSPTFIEKTASSQADSTWSRFRKIPLTVKETNTYIKLDSIGQKRHIDTKLRLFNALILGEYRVGNFNLDFRNPFKINEFEGLRVGLGAFTNSYFSKKYSLGGFYGYGLKDNKEKYGIYGKVFLFPTKGISATVYASSDLREIGDYQFTGERKEAFQNVFASRFDNVKELGFSVLKSQSQGFKWGLGFSKVQNTPLYDYNFSDQVNNQFQFTEFTALLGFNNSQRITSMSKEDIYGRSQYPNFEFLYTLGINTFDYNKFKITVNQSAFLAKIGVFHYRIEGGLILGRLPYSKLFTDNGARNSIASIALSNTFRTIMPYEFVSDKYIATFLRYDFPRALFQRNYSKPVLSIIHNFAYGGLSDRIKHQIVDFKTMEKGLFEGGLEVRDLIRFNYLNFCIYGLGGGFYSRYGNYMNPIFKENVVFKANMTISF
jgi:Family of unknown function (DUF5686)/CarboxypepD_reg-like domain